MLLDSSHGTTYNASFVTKTLSVAAAGLRTSVTGTRLTRAVLETAYMASGCMGLKAEKLLL